MLFKKPLSLLYLDSWKKKKKRIKINKTKRALVHNLANLLNDFLLPDEGRSRPRARCVVGGEVLETGRARRERWGAGNPCKGLDSRVHSDHTHTVTHYNCTMVLTGFGLLAG